MKNVILVILLAVSIPAHASKLNFGSTHLDLTDWSMSGQEKVFHVMNVVDMLQTVNSAAKDPCYREGNAVTRAIIGDHPSPEAVILSSIFYSVAYHYGSKLIENSKMPKWSKNFTFSLTIGFKANTIYQNHNRGVRMFGDNEPVWGCNQW